MCEQPHPYRGNGVHVWHMNIGIVIEARIMFPIGDKPVVVELQGAATYAKR